MDNTVEGQTMTGIRSRLVLAAVISLALVACSKDTAVTADIDAVSTFSKELVSKVKTAADPSSGVASAQAYLEEHRADMRERVARVGSVRGFQISDDTKKKVMGVMMAATSEVNTLKISLMMQVMNDEALEKNLSKLIDDLNALLKSA